MLTNPILAALPAHFVDCKARGKDHMGDHRLFRATMQTAKWAATQRDLAKTYQPFVEPSSPYRQALSAASLRGLIGFCRGRGRSGFVNML